MTALRIAQAHEKLALGMSYDRLYSRTSGYIHFEPESKLEVGVAAVSRALDECGILGLNVVVALQGLLGDVTGEWNEKVRQVLRDNPYPGELAESMTRGAAEVGDFVLAYGDLAEVLDVAESGFGYRSYKVLYVSASPMPGIDEDWFPAQFVRVMWSKQGLEQAVSEAVADGIVPEELAGKLLEGGGREHFREAAAEVWARGLKECVHTRGARARASH